LRVVVADAGPLHDLILIREIELLPRFFETVATPERLRDELCQCTHPASGARMGVQPAGMASNHGHAAGRDLAAPVA
jgi:predicted nucleic acid-binding protein